MFVHILNKQIQGMLLDFLSLITVSIEILQNKTQINNYQVKLPSKLILNNKHLNNLFFVKLCNFLWVTNIN